MKSVLLIGQSNMAGRGYLYEVTQFTMKTFLCSEMADGR